MTQTVNHLALISAAAAKINNEATIALNAALEAATDDDDWRTVAALADIRASARRSLEMAEMLLRYADRHGVRAGASPLEAFVWVER